MTLALLLSRSQGDSTAYQLTFLSNREGRSRLYRLDLPSGAITPLTPPNFFSVSAPAWSADGRWFAFAAIGRSVEIYRMRPNGTHLTQLATNLGDTVPPIWAGGWIIHTAVKQTIYTDIHRVRTDGTQREALTFGTNFYYSPAVSPNGQWIVYTQIEFRSLNLYKMQLDGSEKVRLTDTPADETDGRWSPDSQWILYREVQNGFTTLKKIAVAGGAAIEVMPLSAEGYFAPQWSPDGKWIAVNLQKDGSMMIYRVRADGSERQRLTNPQVNSFGAQWSPDGAWIVYSVFQKGNRDIYRMRADGSQQERLTQHPADDFNPTWSPAIEYGWRAGWLLIIGLLLIVTNFTKPLSP